MSTLVAVLVTLLGLNEASTSTTLKLWACFARYFRTGKTRFLNTSPPPCCRLANGSARLVSQADRRPNPKPPSKLPLPRHSGPSEAPNSSNASLLKPCHVSFPTSQQPPTNCNARQFPGCVPPRSAFIRPASPWLESGCLRFGSWLRV